MMSMLETREYHSRRTPYAWKRKKMEVESWRSGRVLPDLVLLLALLGKLRVFRSSTTGVLVVGPLQYL